MVHFAARLGKGLEMAVAESKKRIQISLSLEVYELLEEAAKRAGISKSALASLAITEWVKEKELDKPLR